MNMVWQFWVILVVIVLVVVFWHPIQTFLSNKVLHRANDPAHPSGFPDLKAELQALLKAIEDKLEDVKKHVSISNRNQAGAVVQALKPGIPTLTDVVIPSPEAPVAEVPVISPPVAAPVEPASPTDSFLAYAREQMARQSEAAAGWSDVIKKLEQQRSA